MSQRDLEEVTRTAQRMVDVINESLQLANKSMNIETKVSRLKFAKQKLHELQEFAKRFPILSITSLNEVELQIREMELEFNAKQYEEVAGSNHSGIELERAGNTEGAIKQYEKLLEMGTDTPHTYRRLAIIYKKKKKLDEELRVLQTALLHIPKSNKKHYEWFENRLSKVNSKQ